jgi:S1-C subfamily serine protease
LAILKIDTKPTSVLPISYSNPEILQEIYVAGFPFGEKFSTSIKMTKGIVSSLTGIGNNYSNIQIDAALQPGNSGGPVFDDKGNVVGVAVAKIDLEYAIEEFGVVPENTNFGIKSSVVINFLESNSIGNLASPLNYKASMTSLGKSVTDATYYVSCMMTMAQIRKVQASKVIYSELIK